MVCWTWKISEGHLLSSNEREHQNKNKTRTKQKQNKKRQKEKNNNNTKLMPEKGKIRALDRENLVVPAASHPIPSPPYIQTHGIYKTPYSQGFRFLDRHSRRRLGSNPWVGPINAALKRLKLATVTPGATSTLSASFASLFIYLPVVGRLFLFLHPRGHKPAAPLTYQTPGSSATTVLEFSAMPNSRTSSATQSVHYFISPSPPAHIFPRPPALGTYRLLVPRAPGSYSLCRRRRLGGAMPGMRSPSDALYHLSEV